MACALHVDVRELFGATQPLAEQVWLTQNDNGAINGLQQLRPSELM